MTFPKKTQKKQKILRTFNNFTTKSIKTLKGPKKSYWKTPKSLDFQRHSNKKHQKNKKPKKNFSRELPEGEMGDDIYKKTLKIPKNLRTFNKFTRKSIKTLKGPTKIY